MQSSSHLQPQQQTDDTSSKRQAAREVIDILHEISILLNTNLDRTQLSLCVSLIENGVNPEALANVIRMLRSQAAKGEAGGDVVTAGASATIAGKSLGKRAEK